MKKHRKFPLILKFTVAILIALTVLFLIPKSTQAFSLQKENFFNGEYWRILTYSFVHFNLTHLFENLVGLLLVGIIAFELGTSSNNYISTYFSSAIFSILPLWLLVSFVAAGSSAIVYALFGFVIFGIKKFDMPLSFIFVVALLTVFGQSIYYFIGGGRDLSPTVIQDLAHFSGLIFGIGIYFIIFSWKNYKDKKASFVLRSIN